MRSYVTCTFLANSTDTGFLPRGSRQRRPVPGGVARSSTSNTHVQEPMNRIMAKYQSCLITGSLSTDSSRFLNSYLTPLADNYANLSRSLIAPASSPISHSSAMVALSCSTPCRSACPYLPRMDSIPVSSFQLTCRRWNARDFSRSKRVLSDSKPKVPTLL